MGSKERKLAPGKLLHPLINSESEIVLGQQEVVIIHEVVSPPTPDETTIQPVIDKAELQRRFELQVRGHVRRPTKTPRRSKENGAALSKIKTIKEGLKPQVLAEGYSLSLEDPTESKSDDRQKVDLTQSRKGSFHSGGSITISKAEVEFVPLSPREFQTSRPTELDQYRSIIEDTDADPEIADIFIEEQTRGNLNGPEPTPIRNVPFIQPSKMSPIVEDSFEPDSHP